MIPTTAVITQAVGRLVADAVARTWGTTTVYEWRLAVEEPYFPKANESDPPKTKTRYITCRSKQPRHAKLTKGTDIWVIGRMTWGERPEEYKPTEGPKAGAGPGFFEPDLRVELLYVLQWRNTGHNNRHNVKQKTDPKIPF